MDWTVFGWAGIQLEIPTTWELSGLSGDQKTGYLRLDDGDMPRLELKWANTRRKKPDLHATLDEYFKLIRKTYKKGTELSFRRNVNLIKDPMFFEGRTVLGFSWKGSIRANGLIFHAGKRITIVQVMGRLKENWRPTVLRIFQSITDNTGTPQTLWSAYGLKLSVPREYKLERQKLLSGYLLFAFVAKKEHFQRVMQLAKSTSNRLQNNAASQTQNKQTRLPDKGSLSVERYGPAEVMLNDYQEAPNPLEAWFRAKYAKAIRGYGFKVESHTDTGDEHLTLSGQQTRLYDSVPLTPVLVLDKLSKRTTLVFHLWRCNHSNRIYVIQSISNIDAYPTVQKVAESIECH